MKKVVLAAFLGIIATASMAESMDKDFSAEAKKVMSFEDPYIADTIRMLNAHDDNMRAHYIQVAKDMMSFEDEYVAETAKMVRKDKQKELHVDP